jgi:hypothetical protein
MADNPKLIGIVRLEIPRLRRGTGPREAIKEVAFDTDGQAWGLVTRITPIIPPIPGSPGMARVDHHRWIRFEAIPFAPEEVITREIWRETPPPKDDDGGGV